MYSCGEEETFLSEAACGCLAFNALIVVLLSSTGLSSEGNSLKAALMFPSSIFALTEAANDARLFLTCV